MSSMFVFTHDRFWDPSAIVVSRCTSHRCDVGHDLRHALDHVTFDRFGVRFKIGIIRHLDQNLVVDGVKKRGQNEEKEKEKEKGSSWNAVA